MTTASGFIARIESTVASVFSLICRRQLLELRVQVADDAAELRAHRHFRRDRHLAAQRVALLDQRHVVATPGRDFRGLHAGRAAANDDDLLSRRRGLQRADAERLLLPSRRVVDAADVHLLEDRVDAALIAADAFADVFEAAFPGFLDDLGIGDVRAGHRDHVRDAVGKDTLGVQRVDDAADREDRHPRDRAADSRRERQVRRRRGAACRARCCTTSKRCRP